MNSKLSLSVIIPTLNRPEDLYGAVASMLKQSYLPYELIIVDQSKEDDSHKRVKNLFSHTKTKIKLLYVHDSEIDGLVSAKNHGVKISSGDIICFLEDDETLDIDYFKKINKVFTENQFIMLC